MKLSSGPARWPHARCGQKAKPTAPLEPHSTEELIEEIRQLRAALAVYRHVAERLMEEKRK
jgi:hypothetical protein